MSRMKNVIVKRGKVAIVSLTQGKTTIIDVEDVPLISQYRWCAERDHGKDMWYAKGYVSKRMTSMHRLLINAPFGIQVDHANRDGLDNRRCNLRLANASLNKANSVIEKNRQHGAMYKGVWWRPDRKHWVAEITKNRKRRFLGCFRDQTDAANAYAKASKQLFGDFARTSSAAAILKTEGGPSQTA